MKTSGDTIDTKAEYEDNGNEKADTSTDEGKTNADTEIPIEMAIAEKYMELEKQNEELQNRVLRVAADFEIFRKRSKMEKEQIADYALAEFTKKMLPVLDNFDHALKNDEASEETKKYMDGVKMVRDQFLGVLKDSGFEEIAAVGEEFNPEYHEAVMRLQDPEIESNTVVMELRKGYKFKNRVIRASMVQVVIND